jgi:hypothetical protein
MRNTKLRLLADLTDQLLSRIEPSRLVPLTELERIVLAVCEAGGVSVVVT